MTRVMVVDDFEPNLQLYKAVVKRAIGEEPLAFDGPVQALYALQTHDPALIVVDYQMPDMDGVQFVRAVRAMEAHEHTPIIMLTAVHDFDVQTQALEAGTTMFLEKPLVLRDFIAQIRRFTVERAPQNQAVETLPGEGDAIVRLHRAMHARNPGLAQRMQRTRDLAVAIAIEMHVDPTSVEELKSAALVYDVGMMAVPDKVLHATSELSRHWAQVVRNHCHTGASILGGAQSRVMALAETLARSHHERFDGSGYPDGLRGEAIPLLARIVAVADAYTAMTSERPYRIEMQVPQALAELGAASGTRYDSAVVATIERMKDRLAQERRSA